MLPANMGSQRSKRKDRDLPPHLVRRTAQVTEDECFPRDQKATAKDQKTTSVLDDVCEDVARRFCKQTAIEVKEGQRNNIWFTNYVLPSLSSNLEHFQCTF